MKPVKKMILTNIVLFLLMSSQSDAQENILNDNYNAAPIYLTLEEPGFKAKVEEKEKKQNIFKSGIEFFEKTRQFQTGLSERGFSVEFANTNDTLMNFGGLLNSRTAVKSMSLLDMSLTLDTEKLGLWKGGTAFILGQTIYGKGLTEQRLGDIQTISSIEAGERTQLGEFWYEQKLFGEKLRLAGGKHDANGEFAILEMAEDYLGSSFTLMPNIPMPSYPDQSMGTWGEITPADWLGFKAGLYDGGGRGDDLGFRTAFEGRSGYITLLQTELKPEIKGHGGNYIFGYWSHSGDVDTVNANTTEIMNSNYGFYTEFQQMIYRENNTDEQGLSLLGQFSLAPSDRNEIARYYGAGCAYKGLFPGRDEDVFGLGLALADLSPGYKSLNTLQNEAAIEVFYKFVLNELLTLQPDFQIIINNGGSRETSFALGLRSIISFAPRSPESL